MDNVLISTRRIWTSCEEVYHEFGPTPPEPLRRGWAAVVVKNPYAGYYAEDIIPMMEALKPLGIEVAERLLTAMDVRSADIATYGKGAIVGAKGELEHGALWHVPGGYAMRKLLGWKEGATEGETHVDGLQTESTTQHGNALAIVPSTKKMGEPGTVLDVPLTNINASYVRGQFDTVQALVPGAPKADELVFVLAMTTGYRIHARVGGLRAEDISMWDGLR